MRTLQSLVLLGFLLVTPLGARAFCGDGVTDGGEQCDTAGPSASCDFDCTLPSCGDGVPNTAAGEQCDTAGASSYCDANCSIASCGDGTVNNAAGEACDDGGTSATCDVDCTFPVCGDGLPNPSAGEQCDDGNQSPDDGCTPQCVCSACQPQAPAFPGWAAMVAAAMLLAGTAFAMRWRSASEA